MRDEDLEKLPRYVEGWWVKELLDRIGIEHTDTRRVDIGVRSVEIEVYATNSEGRRIRETRQEISADDGHIVTVLGDARVHYLELPLSQVWERPAEELDPDPKDLSLEDREQMQADIEANCQERLPLETGGRQCEQAAGHDGPHSYIAADGAVLRW